MEFCFHLIFRNPVSRWNKWKDCSGRGLLQHTLPNKLFEGFLCMLFPMYGAQPRTFFSVFFCVWLQPCQFWSHEDGLIWAHLIDQNITKSWYHVLEPWIILFWWRSFLLLKWLLRNGWTKLLWAYSYNIGLLVVLLSSWTLSEIFQGISRAV